MRKLIVIFAFFIVLEVTNGGKILNKIRDDVEKVEHGVECGVKSLGSLLGLGKKCHEASASTTIATDIEKSGVNVVILKKDDQPPKKDEELPKKDNKPVVQNKLDMRFSDNENKPTEPDPNKAPIIDDDSEEKGNENQEARRIINVGSNCQPGYQADRRGRCKQIVGK